MRPRASYDAVLFDLDGVLTATAGLHAAAWKQTFDPLLAAEARRTGVAQAPFDARRDYVAHVDGRPREDGVPARRARRSRRTRTASPRTGQTIVGATDGSIMRLFVDDEPFNLATARLLAFERTLDLRTGVLSRDVVFEGPRGGRMRIRSRRLASLADRHLVAMEYEVFALDGPAEVAISSELLTHAPSGGADDPRRGKGFAERVLRPLQARAAGARAALRLTTTNSGLELACGLEHRVDGPGAITVEPGARATVPR